jgi:hypothetical protein
MSKAERLEIAKVVRMRAKGALAQRAAVILADFMLDE